MTASSTRFCRVLRAGLIAAAVAVLPESVRGQSSPGTPPTTTLRDVVQAHGRPADLAVGPPFARRVVSYAIHETPDALVIAFHSSSAESLFVSRLSRPAASWTHRAFVRERRASPRWDAGTVVRVHQTARDVYIDTHINPSAGTLLVLSRDLSPVAALSGWLVVALADVVVYHLSAPHFAPTHSLELRTWSGATRRDQPLYPTRPYGEVRASYIDTVRSIYARIDSRWARAANHHLDPDRFNSRLLGSEVVDSTSGTLDFGVEFGGGEGSPAATPLWSVYVRCIGVGTERSRCTEHRAPPFERLVGSRVRFRTPSDTSWRYGMLNRTRTEPPCYVVLLFGPNRTYIAQVPIDSTTSLQRSTMFIASRDYDASDTTTYAGERWVDIQRESVTNATAACTSRRR